MPQDDLTLITSLARKAGEIALRHFRVQHESWEKPKGAGPVTEADIAIDQMLKSALTAARPHYGWLSEETEDDPARLNCDTIFIVDPIDGTRAFMRGEDGFCHAIAIAEQGEITAAAAWFPVRDEMYHAVKGGSAFLNGAPVRISERSEIEGARALAGQRQISMKNWPRGAPPVEREFRNSLVFRHCLVASGAFDLSFSLRPAWEWDVAAGELIAREAGATVTTKEGKRWRYNAPEPRMPGVITGPAPLHADILARLQPSD